MKNGDVNQFVDNLYIGEEMYILYNSITFFIQGWNTEKGFWLERINYNNSDDEYHWEIEAKDSETCVKAFLDTPMWNGKKFWEAESEMTWIDL